MGKKIAAVVVVCLAGYLAVGLNAQEAGAAAESKVQSAPRAAAQAETATLVFYRPKRFTGSGLTPSVYINGQEIARMDNGRYFVLKMAPGKCDLKSSMKSHDSLEYEAKPGVQYFEMVIMTGNWRGGGRLIPTGAADAREAMKKLKPLDKKWATSDKVSFTLPEAKSGG